MTKQSQSTLGKMRIFDYLEIDGLEKLSGIESYDWDLYTIKELVDNAIDADEGCDILPNVSIIISYQRDLFSVSVKNKADFPLHYSKRIFSLDEYVSNKGYYRNNTRGAQGNALKTIISIPYTLQYFTRYNFKVNYYPA